MNSKLASSIESSTLKNDDDSIETIDGSVSIGYTYTIADETKPQTNSKLFVEAQALLRLVPPEYDVCQPRPFSVKTKSNKSFHKCDKVKYDGTHKKLPFHLLDSDSKFVRGNPFLNDGSINPHWWHEQDGASMRARKNQSLCEVHRQDKGNPGNHRKANNRTSRKHQAPLASTTIGNATAPEPQLSPLHEFMRKHAHQAMNDEGLTHSQYPSFGGMIQSGKELHPNFTNLPSEYQQRVANDHLQGVNILHQCDLYCQKPAVFEPPLHMTSLIDFPSRSLNHYACPHASSPTPIMKQHQSFDNNAYGNMETNYNGSNKVHYDIQADDGTQTNELFESFPIPAVAAVATYKQIDNDDFLDLNINQDSIYCQGPPCITNVQTVSTSKSSSKLNNQNFDMQADDGTQTNELLEPIPFFAVANGKQTQTNELLEPTPFLAMANDKQIDNEEFFAKNTNQHPIYWQDPLCFTNVQNFSSSKSNSTLQVHDPQSDAAEFAFHDQDNLDEKPPHRIEVASSTRPTAGTPVEAVYYAEKNVPTNGTLQVHDPQSDAAEFAFHDQDNLDEKPPHRIEVASPTRPTAGTPVVAVYFAEDNFPTNGIPLGSTGNRGQSKLWRKIRGNSRDVDDYELNRIYCQLYSACHDAIFLCKVPIEKGVCYVEFPNSEARDEAVKKDIKVNGKRKKGSHCIDLYQLVLGKRATLAELQSTIDTDGQPRVDPTIFDVVDSFLKDMMEKSLNGLTDKVAIKLKQTVASTWNVNFRDA